MKSAKRHDLSQFGESVALELQPLVRPLRRRCDIPAGDAKLQFEAVGNRRPQQPRQRFEIGLQGEVAFNRERRVASPIDGRALQATRQLHASSVVGNAKEQIEAGSRALRRERQLTDRGEKIERQGRTAKLLAAFNLTPDRRLPGYADRLRDRLRLCGRTNERAQLV
jgi:hypothetical protein